MFIKFPAILKEIKIKKNTLVIFEPQDDPNSKQEIAKLSAFTEEFCVLAVGAENSKINETDLPSAEPPELKKKGNKLYKERKKLEYKIRHKEWE